MTITDVAVGLGGLVTLRKFTIPYNDPNLIALGAVTAGNVNLAVSSLTNAPIQPTTSPVQGYLLNQAAKILGVCIHHTTAFTGTGPLTALTVSVGNSISNTQFTNTQDIFQATGDTVLLETGGLFKCGQITPSQVFARFTATGGNLNVLTAGSVDIYVMFTDVTSPSE